MVEPVSVGAHLARILEAVHPLEVRRIGLLDALGMTIAEDVVAEVALPGFDNSAMDGYAVSFHDIAEARPDRPIHLPVVGEIGAGTPGLRAIAPGTAAKIMTGAVIPQGCDVVVPYEWTDRGVAEVLVEKAPEAGRHIRRAGEDVEVGEVVVSAGTLLGAREIGLLAAVGRADVLSRPRPRVVVMATGSELRPVGERLPHGTIHDSNSWLLAAAVREAGGIAYRVPAVRDDPTAFTQALEDQLVRADLVVTSGGISEGDHDVVKQSLADDLWFGTVAMQPGKPQGFGLIGEDRVPVFTLPGNPVAAYVSFQTFVLPALRALQARTPYERPLRTATLTHGLSSSPGRQHYVRALYDASTATPVGGAGSHLIGDLTSANALIVIPPEVTQLAPGSPVQVLLMDGE